MKPCLKKKKDRAGEGREGVCVGGESWDKIIQMGHPDLFLYKKTLPDCVLRRSCKHRECREGALSSALKTGEGAGNKVRYKSSRS